MPDVRGAVLIVGVACVLRLLAVWQLGDLPLSRTPQLDSAEYLTWAREIAAGTATWPQFPAHAPGYAYFLAALLTLGGGSLLFVRVVQAVLASLSCLLTARIAARAFTPRAFLPAGLLQAAYGPFLYLDTALLAEPLFVFLLLLGIDRALHVGPRVTPALLAGLTLGAAAIVRPTGIVVLAAVLALLLWRERERPYARRAAASLALTAVIVVLPVMVLNWRISGTPMIQAYGGMNLYLGNTPASDGGARARPGGGWDGLEADASRARVPRAKEDAYYVWRTIDEVSDAPLNYVQLLGSKLLWLTQGEELRDSHSWYFFRHAFPVLAWLPGFGLLLALAASLLVTRPRVLAPEWVVLPAAALALTVLFLVVGFRYRAPLVPFVAMAGGAGLVALLEAARAKRRGVALAASGVALCVLLASTLRVDAESRNLSEEWSLTALSLLSEGALPEADVAARRAIALDERSSYAWDVLGLTALRQQRRDVARDAFTRAVSMNDSNALAWHHLGVAREQSGDDKGAHLAYQRALEITPERTEVILSLALLLHRTGRLSEAQPLLVEAAQRGEGRAHFALALTALQFRDHATAQLHAREAVRLLPEYAPARQLLRAAERSQ